VIVEPGYAIAPNGDEIALPRGVALVVALDGDEGYVSVRPWDHPCPDGTPTTGATSNPRCIEEACVVAVAADLPRHALGVARLRRAESGWTVDTAYEAPRAR